MLFTDSRRRGQPFRQWVALFGWLVFILGFVPEAAAERLAVKNYTIADGLPQNSINKIVEDRDGFFWFCTGRGLSRYDGYGFTNLTHREGLPSDRINDFLASSTGDYWIATTGGLVQMTPDGTLYDRPVMADEALQLAEPPLFTTYLLPDSKNRIISKLIEDGKGRIWVGTGDGLWRLEKSGSGFALVRFALDLSAEGGARYIYSLAEDRSGALWVGTESKLFRISADGRVSRYSSGSAAVYFRAVREDRAGNLWVGTLKKGLLRFGVDGAGDPQPSSSFNFDETSELNWIESITESFDGKLWIGTSGGLFEFDPAGAKFYRYTRHSGIGYNRYQAVYEDRNGNLWLGTRTNGVFRVERRGLVSYGLEDKIAFIRSVSADNQGNLLLTAFLSETGAEQRAKVEEKPRQKSFEPFRWALGRLTADGFQWIRPRLPAGVRYFGWGEHQLNFQARDGEWWIATGEGLFRFPKVAFEKLPFTRPLAAFDEKSGLTPPAVFRLFEDSRGDVWISTSSERGNGFFRWQRATNTLVNAWEIEGLPAVNRDPVSALAEDRAGNLWVGFHNRGLARISGDRAQTFDSVTAAPQSGINSIFADREGRLWLAFAREGIGRIDQPESESPEVVTIGEKDGLSSSVTFTFAQDRQGLIYIGTDRDVNRLNPLTGEISQLKPAREQPQREFRSAFCDARGVLWFGTTEGLVKYLPVPPAAQRPPTVLLTRVEIEGQPQKVPLTGAGELDFGELAPDQNQIRVDLVSVAALADDDLRYQYKFEFDRDWSAPSSERSINFAGLAAGDYRIFFRAVAGDGTVSEKSSILSFRILPPFYRRWWFLTLASALLIFVVYTLYRNRVKKLLEIERMQTRIATDLHDDIGANLTRISLLSEVARQQTANGNGKLLASIADIARESVASMNDIVWAVSPKNDRLLDLTRRMRRHAEEVFALRDVDLKFNAPGAAPDLRLGVGLRRDVLLIFKEAVNNAVRHSHCSQVEIKFEIEKSILTLRVADNGRGFEAAQESDGQGLRSMMRRAAAIGGRLRIDSAPEKGTVVELRLPLQKSARVAESGPA